ncbi:DUF3040 domain-containing protein [Geodermatophilus poikilotrophus]|uniref:DUF3040 domain-containing protein n=1 Tax=Geodermatophilus poikilotrophus TaxID=1333667 RepID=A0A1I0B8X6_9ACTN|nr:DUF3040 domain-containing protein [Geodermatophilus poikilotrophus]SET03162.1 Protein of unknown function [Geodermatophilus poikilotrophus]
MSPTAGTAVGFLALAHVEVDVPLSEHEQRLLEQIERALVDDDPKFASSVRSGDRRGKARRKLQLGFLLSVVGMAALIGGAVIPSVPLGALGFLVAFGGLALAVLNYRSATGVVEAGPGGPAGGSAPGRGGRAGRGGGKVRRQPLKNRLEERFRRRYDQ